MPDGAGRIATYADAGVDIAAAEENVRRIGRLVRSTHGPAVLGRFGAFAGLYRLQDVKVPVLVASTDGVGSKLDVARALGQHEVLGRDLVNLSVDDVLTVGATPLFFLDYVAVHALDHATMEGLVSGMALACRENGCALLGGETAQLADLYQPGQYDLAGFVVGVVEESEIVDGAAVREGDMVWGLPSTGLHTNGYSLARAIVRDAGLDLASDPGGLGTSLGAALLAPHPSYLRAMEPLIRAQRVRGMAHVTGGGLPGNVRRVLPDGVAVELEWGAWPVPPIFDVLRRFGNLAFDEMWRVFNLGLGFVFVTSADQDVAGTCPGALPVGRVVQRRAEPVLLRGAPLA